MTPTIMKVNEEEIAWINMKLEAAKLFIKAFSPDDAEKEITLTILDRAFTAWTATTPTDVQHINEVIDNVGIVVGQKLVDDLGLNWVVTKDQNGIDLAVLAYPNKGDILFYPVKLIAERVERRETNFIENLYKNLEQQLLQLFARY
ncbi:MAG: DUF3806 domain-containing protein [Anaerolineales bacterium]